MTYLKNNAFIFLMILSGTDFVCLPVEIFLFNGFLPLLFIFFSFSLGLFSFSLFFPRNDLVYSFVLLFVLNYISFDWIISGLISLIIDLSHSFVSKMLIISLRLYILVLTMINKGTFLACLLFSVSSSLFI